MRILLSVILSSTLLLSGCSAIINLADTSEISLNNLQSIEVTQIQVPAIPKGTKDGEYLRYYPNGELKYKSWVAKGCYDRYVNAYYNNGKLQMSMPLKNCQVNGVIKKYQPNGRINSEMTIRNGVPYGAFKFYHDTPKNGVYLQGFMENGAITSVVKQLDENGNVVNKAQVLDGEVKILK